jgi:hypothetical protein
MAASAGEGTSGVKKSRWTLCLEIGFKNSFITTAAVSQQDFLANQNIQNLWKAANKFLNILRKIQFFQTGFSLTA